MDWKLGCRIVASDWPPSGKAARAQSLFCDSEAERHRPFSLPHGRRREEERPCFPRDALKAAPPTAYLGWSVFAHSQLASPRATVSLPPKETV
ncbi:hypothetical protein PGT21_009344 [Puccinia graminis f. sp. tritici]|uniref:Uncharacterized protein n=1 Tax=Puccinia graminis f. sp. tritici TaxID=56615 RepID=A0A5B0MF76_PUCGR|nr:hypothetical protein PGT21_009344 [Puccinia graminis f. sp. tritici]